MNKVIPLLLLCWGLFALPSFSQVNYTAKDQITPYDGPFRPGVNLGYYPSWNQRELGNLAAGNPDLGILGMGAKAVRPVLSESVLEIFGYDVAVRNFEHWRTLGMDNFTATLTQPVDWHRDWTEYCPGKPSNLFANLYTDIWDDGTDGTPYNDENYWAAYVYKTVSTYTEYVDFWEIWNEPGFDYTGNTGWRDPGDPEGNWWDNDPDPCDYILQAPIEHFVRTMRIAYEVIKTIAPEDKIIGGGFGYESFLDAILRNTDNPDGGSVTAEYPHNAGAYFEIMGLHSYPHFDGTTYRGSTNLRERHSDRAADGILFQRDKFQEVYDDYDYDGITYPKKLLLATEMNVPSSYDDSGNYFASDEGQRNFLMKAYANAMRDEVIQFHVFSLSTKPTSPYGFHTMGMYEYLEDVPVGEEVMRDGGLALKTTTDMLWGTAYDVNQTANMQLPDGVIGHAFRKPDNTHVYMLWAETTIDQSEFASEVYDFPTGFGFSSLEKYKWDHALTQVVETTNPLGIQLSGSPEFFIGNNSSTDCVLNSSVSNITCDDQGTESVTDDTYTFDLYVETNSALTQSFLSTINGQTIQGNYFENITVGPYLITDGSIPLNVWAEEIDGCSTFIEINPPAPCSFIPGVCDNSILPNNNFEDGTDEWDVTGSVMATADAITGAALTLSEGNARIRQQLTLGNDDSYTFSGHAKVDGGDGKAYVGLKFLSSSWEPLLTAYERVENQTYEAFSYSYDTPAGTAYIQVTAFTRNGDIALTVDDFCLVVGNGNPPISKGDLKTEGLSVTPYIFDPGSDVSIVLEYSNPTDVDVTQNTVVKMYLTEDTNIDSTDPLLLVKNIAGLPANQSNSIDLSLVDFSAAPGSYYFAVVLDAEDQLDEENENNNLSFFGISLNDIVDPPGEFECESEGDFPWHDWISSVEVNGQIHNSSKRKYSDFQDITFELHSLSNNDFALGAGFSYFTFDEYFQIFIDFNQDGYWRNDERITQFIMSAPPEDTDEKVSTFTLGAVPYFSGTTKMRVVMSREEFNGPCGTFDFGEVEDYTVVINDQTIQPFVKTDLGFDIQPIDLHVFPNPTSSVLNILLDGAVASGDELLLMNNLGQVLWSENLAEGSSSRLLNAKNYSAGIYHIVLKQAGGVVATERVVVQ